MLRLAPALLLTLAACTGAPSAPEASGVPDGAWRLVSADAFDVTGERVYAPEVQTGSLVVSGEHYSFLWTRAPRPHHATH